MAGAGIPLSCKKLSAAVESRIAQPSSCNQNFLLTRFTWSDSDTGKSEVRIATGKDLMVCGMVVEHWWWWSGGADVQQA